MTGLTVLPAMVARQQAVAAAVARYAGKPFAWGECDCIRPAAMVLKALGHRVALAGIRPYSSLAGARRALTAAGYADLAEAMDAIPTVVRIPWSRVLIGDIVALPGESAAPGESDGGWSALTVAVNNSRLLGFGLNGLRAECGVGAPLVVPEHCWKVL